VAVIGCDMPRWLLLFPYSVLLAVSACYWLERMWVECKWYFTVMAAMINGKEAGSLFPSKECYQVVGLLTGYNSKNWPAVMVELTRSVCYRTMTKTGMYKV